MCCNLATKAQRPEETPRNKKKDKELRLFLVLLDDFETSWQDLHLPS